MASPIGGFMPIPLAMMIPFMAAQSMVMGDAFGRAFQHGKRKISAMTNEEFNKTNLPQMMEEIITDYKQIIPSLQQGIKDSTTLQTTIVSEMLQLLPKLVTGLVSEVAENIGQHPQSTTNIETSAAATRTPATRPSTVTRVITATSHSVLKYTYIHISGSSKRTVSKITRRYSRQSHANRIQALWKTGKSRLAEKRLPPSIGRSKMNEAVAYKSSWEVHYQQHLLPILN